MMKKTMSSNVPIIVFIFIVIVLKAPLIFAAPPLDLKKEVSKYPLGFHLDILEDKNGVWTLDDVRSSGIEKKWIPSQKPVPNFGYTSSVYWIRFRIRGNSQLSGEWYLEVGYSPLDHIQFYFQGTDGIYHMKETGDLFPFGQREVRNRNFIFSLTSSESEKVYYVRVKTESSVQLPLTLWEPKTLMESIDVEQYIFGVYYGIIAVMILYNLFIFFSIRDWSYLFYVLFIACFSLMQMSLDGRGYQYLWPDFPLWANLAIPFWMSTTAVGALFFAYFFLQTKIHVPLLHKISYLLLGAMIICIPISFLAPYRIAIKIAIATLFTGSIWALIAATAAQIKGYRPARFYLMAWAAVLLGAMLFMLKSVGVLPSMFFTNFSLQIGAALEVVLLSLGLADKINIMRKEQFAAQKAVVAAQEQAVANLEKADKLKDEFLANTSHELRTPLNGIIGLSESLLDGVEGGVNKGQAQNLRMIVHSGKRLSNLVNDILDFSKMKNQDIQLQLKTVSLKSIADIVLKISEPLLGDKSVKLINAIPEPFPQAQADENRLQQILLNLLGNAVKFTHQGSITVSAKQQEQLIRVSIKDTGIGIPKNKLEEVFQAFKQADGSTERQYGGTGLGLTVTKQLVELHGGTIGVESVEGEGSTFFFTLPLSDAESAVESERRSERKIAGLEVEAQDLTTDDVAVIHSEEAATDANTVRIETNEAHVRQAEMETSAQMDPPGETDDEKQTTILVVDDEPINIQVVKNQLRLKNYEVISAQDGFHALEILRGKTEDSGPDLVLLDLMMPRMSGYEVCRKIRETFKASELPVIMLTAKNQVEDLIEGFNAQANDYLTKPFQKEELQARVATHIKLKRAVVALKEANETLEEKILERTAQLQQKTNDINNMLQNMHQGILSVTDENLSIHPEYSQYLETILETNEIASTNVMNTLFAQSNLGPDTLNQISMSLKSAFGVEIFIWEMNKHLLVSEFQKTLPDGRLKILELDWDPMVCGDESIEKMLVTVRDVTELRKLQIEAEAQRQELEIIGQILTISNNRFKEFMSNANELLDKNQKLIESTDLYDAEIIATLFRNIHTIKGNARTYGFSYLTDTLHEAEETYDQLRKNQGKSWDQAALLGELLEIRESMKIYIDLYFEKLATFAVEDGTELIEKSLLEKIRDLAKQEQNIELDRILAAFETETLGGILKEIIDGLPTMASALEKDAPNFEMEDHGIRFSKKVASTLKDIFTHIFRNAIDHGIEKPSIRMEKGKAPQGNLQVDVELADKEVILHISDDGAGLNLSLLRQKALEAGVISTDAIISDEEIANMIFYSGISTAEMVSDISGRGVGMDTVKRFLQQENGDINVLLKEDKSYEDDFGIPFELAITIPSSLALQI